MKQWMSYWAVLGCHVSHRVSVPLLFWACVFIRWRNKQHTLVWRSDLWTLSKCWVYIHAFGRCVYLQWLSGAHLIGSCNPWESNPWRWCCKRHVMRQSRRKSLKHKPGLDTFDLKGRVHPKKIKVQLITFMLFQTWMAFVLRRNNDAFI